MCNKSNVFKKHPGLEILDNSRLKDHQKWAYAKGSRDKVKNDITALEPTENSIEALKN